MQRTEKWLHNIFPFVFMIGGLLALIAGSQDIIKGFSSYWWKTTQAKVLESNIIQSSRGQSREAGKKFKPHIEYSYSLDGEIYFSERILFGVVSGFRLFSSSEVNAKKWVNKYPSGSTVGIYFNPSNKSESTIIKGVSLSSFFLPSFGIVLIVVGLVIRNRKVIV